MTLYLLDTKIYSKAIFLIVLLMQEQIKTQSNKWKCPKSGRFHLSLIQEVRPGVSEGLRCIKEQ